MMILKNSATLSEFSIKDRAAVFGEVVGDVILTYAIYIC